MKRRRRTHENKENEDTGSHKDTLSDLPDSVLTHILSFLKAKDAVQTCLLSTRWKDLWKRLPTLRIYTYHFRTYKSFAEFVNRVMFLRDASTAVNALDYHESYTVNSDLVESIVRYAVSHNVNRLRISCYLGQFPPSLFSCLSLTSLDMQLGSPQEFPNSLNLPALNYLKLRDFSFCSANNGRIEPFSTFNRLNTLILRDCFVPDAQTLCISNTMLLNLSINSHYVYPPYLISKLDLSASNLCSFTFSSGRFLKLYGSSLDSIKEARIDVHMDMEPSNHADTRLVLLNWLIELVNIKSLTVSAATLRALSLIPDLLKVKPPSWYNLKSLKVKRDQNRYIFSRISQRDVNLELGDNSGKEYAKLREAIIPDGIIEFLLQNSPSVKVDIVD